MEKHKSVRQHKHVLYNIGVNRFTVVGVYCFDTINQHKQQMIKADEPDLLVAKKLGNTVLFSGGLVCVNGVLIGHTIDMYRRNHESN
jgi:hypothetical protein